MIEHLIRKSIESHEMKSHLEGNMIGCQISTHGSERISIKVKNRSHREWNNIGGKPINARYVQQCPNRVSYSSVSALEAARQLLWERQAERVHASSYHRFFFTIYHRDENLLIRHLAFAYLQCLLLTADHIRFHVEIILER